MSMNYQHGEMYQSSDQQGGFSQQYQGNNELTIETLPHPSSEDESYHNYQLLRTNSGAVPPLSVYNVYVQDDGSCNPKYMRPILCQVPKKSSFLRQSGVPFGIVMNPLARPGIYDQPNFCHRIEMKGTYTNEKNESENIGPIRCRRCRCYINPNVRFVNNGRHFMCNFCGYENDVPSWYYYNVDSYGKRQDLPNRPELQFGSVEYVLNPDLKDYYFRKAEPMTYLFVIDVTKESKRKGLFSSVLSCLETLQRLSDGNLDKCRFGVITFSQTIHFFNFKGFPKVMVVGDVTSGSFIPAPKESLLTFEEFLENREEYVKYIVDTVETIRESQNSGGAALRMASKFLDENGGKIMFFSTRNPNFGPGSNASRDHTTLYGAKNQEKLFVSTQKFWDKLSTILPQRSISIDMFLFPDNVNTFIESGMMSTVCRNSNGHLYLYSNYNFICDLERFKDDLNRAIYRETGYDGVLRIRTSEGFDLKNYEGFYHVSNNTHSKEIDLACIDEDSSLIATLEHDEDIPTSLCYVQCALLYTNRSGQRVIRVHTMRCPVADDIKRVFDNVSVETLSNYYAKFYATKVLKGSLSLENVRETLVKNVTEVLSNYRKNVSKPGPQNQQLVLSKALSFFPLIMLGLIKSTAFKPGTDVPIDVKIRLLFNLVKMNQRQFHHYVYPRLLPLHRLPTFLDYLRQLRGEQELNVEELDVTEEETKKIDDAVTRDPLPTPLPLRSSLVESTGLYLIDDGMDLGVFIGKDCSPTLLRIVFGIDNLTDIQPTSKMRIDVESFIGKRISLIVQKLRNDRHQSGRFYVVKQTNQQRQYFFSRMVDDRTSDNGYLEFVCKIHSRIRGKLKF